MSISRQISEFSIGLQYTDLPKEVIHEVKRYMYDSIGCALGGYHTKDVNIIRDIYMEMGGKGEATVLGFGDKLPAVNTTFINSLMVRALDFNDIFNTIASTISSSKRDGAVGARIVATILNFHKRTTSVSKRIR